MGHKCTGAAGGPGAAPPWHTRSRGAARGQGAGLARGAEGPHSGPWKVSVTEVDPELSRAPQSAALFKMGLWPFRSSCHQHCGEEGPFLSTGRGGGGRLESCAFLFNQSQKKPPLPQALSVPPPLGVLNSWSWDTPGCELRSERTLWSPEEHSAGNCQVRGPGETESRGLRGEGTGSHRGALPLKNPDHKQGSKAGRLTQKAPRVSPMLGPNPFKMEGGRGELRPGSSPAQGRRGRATHLSVKTL